MSTWSDLKNNPRLKIIYDTRVKIIQLIRQFFWSQDFCETDTPAAVRLASQEPYLNPISITISDPRGEKQRMYLRTSPEYALKKLLAAGYAKIFELAKCWRDGESFGGNHNTEFTMLEWYRAPGQYQDIMGDTEKLFKYVGKKLGIKILKYQDKEIKIFAKWDRISMKELWQRYLQANLDDCLEIDKLKNLAEAKGHKVDDNEEYENIFYKIFLNEIEPKLGLERPVFVYNYPARMCSLSRPVAKDNRYAERFELYIGGLELANAFGELTDAEQQKNNLARDRVLRQKLGKEVWPVDEDFIAALAELDNRLKEDGLAGHSSVGATAGGIALGVDRMVLLFTGAKDLNEVIFDAVKDQIKI